MGDWTIRRAMMRARGALLAAALLCGCGPQLGDLEKGERGRVVDAYSGDTLVLDSGLRVFLAEIDAPRGDAPHARAAQQDLEALALHREAQLAYGGTRRWNPSRSDGDDTVSETAIAHVFVKSEGGRWIWLQQALVLQGAAYVQPRADNHARMGELYSTEAHARETEAGLWSERAYRTLSPARAAEEATTLEAPCQDRSAPFRFVEGVVRAVRPSDRRIVFELEAPQEAPFSLVAFGRTVSDWHGPAPSSLEGQRVLARGNLEYLSARENDRAGVAQMCIWDSGAIERLAAR